jgi:hypothetical protein
VSSITKLDFDEKLNQIRFSDVEAQTMISTQHFLSKFTSVVMVVGELTPSPFLDAIVRTAENLDIPFVGIKGNENGLLLESIYERAVKLCPHEKCALRVGDLLMDNRCNWI